MLCGTVDTVDATPEQGHGECHANPAQHQDMGHHTWPEMALHDQGWGTAHQSCTAPGKGGYPHLGSASPGEKDSGHSNGGTACPVTQSHTSAPRGPCLHPGTPGHPAAGLKPAAASAP